MADDKPVDSAQIKLDKRGTAAAGGAAASMGGLVFKIVAVLFVVGNVTALYVLHFVNRPSPTTRFSFSNFEAVDGSKAKVGDVVSLSATSKLRNGAGTTAYMNRATLNDQDVKYYEYLNVAKLGTTKTKYTTNLMSYRRVHASSKESVLTTFTVDLAAKTVSISGDYDKTKNVITSDAIRDIATLSDTAALVMTVDDSTYTYKTYVTSASISGVSGATLAPSTKTLVATGSITSYMTALNSNSAIIAYYEPYSNVSYYQNVVIATVASNGEVTLSTPKQFGPNNYPYMADWGRPVTISSSEGSFAIPYHAPDDGLCLVMAAYSTTSKTVGDFTSPVCNSKYQPTFFPEGIMLSDNIMLIAFHDTANNNALTLVTVYVTAKEAYFRSSFVFQEASGMYNFGSPDGFYLDVSLTMLSGNRVAVAFLNPATNGRQSVKIVKYSLDSLSFKDVTPVMPVANSKFTLNLQGDAPYTATDRSVTQRVLAVGDDSVVAMHLGMRGPSTYQHVALVEAFGAPVGVLRDLKGHKASVAISGKATKVCTKAKGDLLEGQFYYATTAGYVASPVAGSALSSAEVFVTSEDPDMLVSADSKVGLATDDDELFVSTAF